MTYDNSKTLKENSVDNLTDHQKYLIVKNHSIPGSSFPFPTSFKHGFGRSCKPIYLTASFVYSQNDEAVFWLQCSKFLNSDVKNDDDQNYHVGNSYHTDATVKALEINDKFEKPANTIESQTNKDIQNRHEIYPQFVEILARIVHLIGKQGLAFRGHRESLVEEGNTGIFLGKRNCKS